MQKFTTVTDIQKFTTDTDIQKFTTDTDSHNSTPCRHDGGFWQDDFSTKISLGFHIFIE